MEKKALDVLKEIKKGKIHKLYILSGENSAYLKNSIVEELKKVLITPEMSGFDYVVYYGTNIDPLEILRVLDSPPFGKSKLVVLKDAEKTKKADIKKIISHEIPEFSTFVILFNGKLKLTPSEKDNVIVNSYSITKTVLKAWIKKKVKEHGKSISDDAVLELISRLDNDLFVISSEINKVVLYIGERKQITKEDVEFVVQPLPEIKIFDLIDVIVSGKKNRALKMLKEFLETQGSSPEQLLSILTKRFMQIALIKELITKGVKKSEISSAAMIYPSFVVNKLLPIAQSMDYKSIIEKYQFLVRLDIQSKIGEANLPLFLRLFVEKS